MPNFDKRKKNFGDFCDVSALKRLIVFVVKWQNKQLLLFIYS